MKPDLSVVVVNYNAGRWLQDALRTLFQRVGGVRLEVVVIDNGSYDGSLDGVRQSFPEVRAIRNRRNLGFAKAVNQGIRATCGRYVLLLNPDTTVLSGGWDAWLGYMDAHPEVGVAGAKVYDDESRRNVQLSCRRFPTLLNYFFNRHSLLTRLFPNNRFSRRYLMRDWDHRTACEVDWVSGCCMLLRRAMLDQIGLLDEGYKMFSEDVDLCLRAHRAGWGVRYHPGVEIAHHTGSLRAQANARTLVERHFSLWRFCKKYYAGNPLFRALLAGAVVGRLGALLGWSALRRVAPYALDVALIQTGVVLAFAARSLWEFPWTLRALSSYLDVAAGYTAIQLFLLYVFNLYRRPPPRFDDYLDILPQVVKAISLGTLMLVFTAFFDRQFVLPRGIVVLSWAFNMALLTGWRWLVLYVEQRHLHPKRVLIYGTGRLAALVEDELCRRFALHFQPVGFVRPSTPEACEVEPERVLGGFEELDAVTKAHAIDEIVFAPDGHDEAAVRALLARCPNIHVNTRVATDLFEAALGNTHLTHFHVPFLDPEVRASHGAYAPLKRVLDVLGAGTLLVLAMPAMGLIALALWRQGGPAWVRLPRVGARGQPFALLKFRKTQAPSDDEEDLFAMTAFGRFLRRVRLDELPQLVNVVRGEMSLVGPQPEAPKTVRALRKAIPQFEQRFRVRPGMTGWAQVELKFTTSAERYREKLQYDLYYLKNMSLALDVKILLKSFWVVLCGRGVR